MFENFKKITINGGCFEGGVSFDLFKTIPMTVVYGRNGSGKTTIAKSIAELVLPDEKKNPEYSVTSDVAIGTEQARQVAVFDEDFATEQVKFKKEGIQTIVMLGEAGVIDQQIEALEAEKKATEVKIAEQEVLRKIYDDEGNVKSPIYQFNKLWNALREEGGWADTERDVKGNLQRPKINEALLNSFLEMEEPAESYEKLHARMLKDIEVYSQSENAHEVYWEGARAYPDSPKNVQRLLRQRVYKPKLSKREEKLLSFLAEHPHEERKRMLDEGWEFCPLCLREIKATDKVNITEFMTKMLNKEAEEYQKKLEDAMTEYAALPINLPYFPGTLYQKELFLARKAIEEMNDVTTQVRDAITSRMMNVYYAKRVRFDEMYCYMYKEAWERYEYAMQTLKLCVDSFNHSVKKRKELKERILLENKQGARKLLATVFEIYRQAKTDSYQNAEDLKILREGRDNLKQIISALKEKIARTDIALDYINEELNYVFYSNRKLKLEAGVTNAGEKVYKLKVNGRNVRPEKISVGERNVLALCYFFAKLYSDKNKEKRYKDEYLIVVDDPVSSFDYGNRLGVMTLLRYQLGNIMKGNGNSRILVMSHDLYSVFDLVKIKKELTRQGGGKYLELVNKQLKPAEYKHEYANQIQKVFNYAVDTGEDDPDDVKDMNIGNTMRRMLEAFSTFCYCSGFEDMLRREDLLVKIPEDKQAYFGNFMCRLTLNGESHSEESTYALNSITPYFTREEKVQTAKSLLLFLYYVNEPHLKAYLKEKADVVKSWENEGWLVSTDDRE